MDDREIWVRFAAAMVSMDGPYDPSCGVPMSECAAVDAARGADVLLKEYRARYAAERDEETALRQWRAGEQFRATLERTRDYDGGVLAMAAPKPCATCWGNGIVIAPGNRPEPCPDCAGESGGNHG